MSWEEHKPIERPCPCGMGHYAVTGRSDDWNRYEEQWDMRCSQCIESYGLYTHNYSRKGIDSTYHCWLPRPLLKELSVTADELEKAKESLSAYATTHFLECWNRHFIGKTKKTIWSELTEEGKQYPSLPTFYLHVRESSLEQQLARYFDYHELPTVVRIPQLSASKLPLRIEQVREMERMLEEKHSHARQQAFV